MLQADNGRWKVSPSAGPACKLRKSPEENLKSFAAACLATQHLWPSTEPCEESWHKWMVMAAERGVERCSCPVQQSCLVGKGWRRGKLREPN